MTEVVCAAPGCENLFTRSGRGRPRLYCSPSYRPANRGRAGVHVVVEVDHEPDHDTDRTSAGERVIGVEARFKVMRDFLGLRPVFHFAEERVRGHIALCVISSVIEALMAIDLERAGATDPDLPDQVMTPRRAPHELDRIRIHELNVGERHVEVVTRRNGLQASVLSAMGVNTAGRDQAAIA